MLPCAPLQLLPPLHIHTIVKKMQDTEELLVYLDFGQFLPFEELIDPDTQIKLIGIDSEHPVAQINGRFYQGDYEFTTGTKLFFSESHNPPVRDEIESDSNEKIIPYEYLTKTNKTLKMNRMFISAKNDTGRVKVEMDKDENASKYEVTTTYSEALSRFLPVGMEPPRMIGETEDGLNLTRQRQDEEEDENELTDAIDERNKM